MNVVNITSNIDGNNTTIDVINSYIDACSNLLTHYDVAIIVHKVFKNRYRFLGQSKWEYLNRDTNTWIADERKKKLKSDIKTVIADLFISRAMYWYGESNKVNDINHEIHVKFMSEKMLRASHKIRNDKFIDVVIREAKPFFDIHND